MSKLKCNSCNIVVNELLTFIDIKIQVMDNESLIRLCRTSFSVSEIDEAKSLLFESVHTDKRKISRRSDGKAERDLQDIITVLKEVDPDKIPLFVARELHKLPPVTFDHIDVTRLLKDLLVLREDLTKLKAECVTKQELQEAMQCSQKEATDYLQYPLSQQEYRPINVNLKRGAFRDSFQLDSGPIGLINVDKTLNKSSEETVPTQKNTSTPIVQSENKKCNQHRICNINEGSLINSQQNTGRLSSSASKRRSQRRLAGSGVGETGLTYESLDGDSSVPCKSLLQNVNKHSVDSVPVQKTFASVVNNDKPWQPEKPQQGWIENQRNKLRNRFIGMTGRASNGLGKFKAAEVKVPLLVYNVDKEATGEDIKNYIFNKTGEVISLYKLRTKREKSYDSYKIFIAETKLPLFLDDKMWPSNIKFRLFINLRESAYAQRKQNQT